MSDMAGYAARVAVERSGSCRDTTEPQGCERHRCVKPRGRHEWERVSQILNGGAMPLDLLQERVEAWIKEQVKSKKVKIKKSASPQFPKQIHN